MRWYVVAQTKDGRRFIEAEIAREHLTNDVNDTVVTPAEAEQDPELREALADWKAGDDRVLIADRAHWALYELTSQLSPAWETVHDIAMSARKPGVDSDDVYVKAAEEIDELLCRASDILVSTMPAYKGIREAAEG